MKKGRGPDRAPRNRRNYHLSQDKEKREHQLANLRPYPPGVSGNPGGLLKMREGTEAYRKLARMDYEELKSYKPETGFEAIAKGQMNAAERGKTMAAIEILDRTEGKVPTPLEVESNVTVNITISEDDLGV